MRSGYARARRTTEPLLGLWLLLVPATALAQAAPADEDAALREGVSCYSKLDYPCTVTALTRYLASAPIAQRERRATAHKYLALAYLAIGQQALAQQSFAAALREDPSFELEADEASPKTQAVLKAARERTGILVPQDEATPEPTPEPEPEPTPEPVVAIAPEPEPDPSPAPPPEAALELATTLGSAILTGDDAELFSAGPLATLEARWLLRPNLLVGLLIRYHVHGVRRDSLENGPLHAGGAALTAAWRWRQGAFHVDVGLAAGGAAYGAEGLVGVGAFELSPRVEAGYRLGRQLSIVAGMAPTLAVARQPDRGDGASGDPVLSFYFPLSAGLSFGWSP